MRLECPHCKQYLSVSDSELGNPVACPACKEFLIIPKKRFAPSVIINDFVIKGELGRGGMGNVFLAHQISLDRDAAIKILHEQYSQDHKFIQDLIKEAQVAAKLNHPNIVQCYAVGSDEGVYFYAMEYVEGKNLKEILKKRWKIPAEEIVRILRPIAVALDHAWKEARLVHRDIKPDNIMITADGIAKLADLGLARPAQELYDTKTDSIRGTPQYISPEVVLDEPIDFRSDIYSLGCVFYHCVTGHFPFDAPTPVEMVRKHVETEVKPPSEYSSDISKSLCQVIKKMMMKRPEDRYQDYSLLINDLNKIEKEAFDQRIGAEKSQAPSKESKKKKKKAGETTKTKSKTIRKRTGKLDPDFQKMMKKNEQLFTDKPDTKPPYLILIFLLIIVVSGIGLVTFMFYRSDDDKSPGPANITSSPESPIENNNDKSNDSVSKEEKKDAGKPSSDFSADTKSDIESRNNNTAFSKVPASKKTEKKIKKSSAKPKNKINKAGGADKPVAHWSMDDGSGTSATDSFGNHHGTLINGPVWIDGVDGKALKLDGVDDRIECGSISDLNIGTGDFSVVVYVKLDPEQPAYPTIVGKGGGAEYDAGYWFSLFGKAKNRKLAFRVSDGTKRLSAYSEVINEITDGQWHQIAVTLDRDAHAVLYFDGNTIGSEDFSAHNGKNIISTKKMNIGSSRTPMSYWKGGIDELRIYDRVLSERDLADLRPNQKTGK